MPRTVGASPLTWSSTTACAGKPACPGTIRKIKSRPSSLASSRSSSPALRWVTWWQAIPACPEPWDPRGGITSRLVSGWPIRRIRLRECSASCLAARVAPASEWELASTTPPSKISRNSSRSVIRHTVCITAAPPRRCSKHHFSHVQPTRTWVSVFHSHFHRSMFHLRIRTPHFPGRRSSRYPMISPSIAGTSCPIRSTTSSPSNGRLVPTRFSLPPTWAIKDIAL